MIDVPVVANIAGDATQPVMLHLELASAMTTAQQSNQQSAAIAHRSGHHLALHVGVPADDPPVALIVFPRDVALVVVTNQHLPCLLAAVNTARDDLTASFEANL
jgi:hypothetical protein